MSKPWPSERRLVRPPRGHDPEARSNLGVSLHNIGMLLCRLSRPAEAKAMFLRAAEHDERAVQLVPFNTRYSLRLSQSTWSAGAVGYNLGDRADGVRGMQKATSILSKLATQNPAVPQFRSELVWNYRFLAGRQRELGQTAEAARSLRLARDRIESLPKEGPEALFTLACVQAGCAGSRVDEQAEITADEQTERQRDADRAVETLKQAIAAGFRDTKQLRFGGQQAPKCFAPARTSSRSGPASSAHGTGPGPSQTSPAARLETETSRRHSTTPRSWWRATPRTAGSVPSTPPASTRSD